MKYLKELLVLKHHKNNHKKLKLFILEHAKIMKKLNNKE